MELRKLPTRRGIPEIETIENVHVTVNDGENSISGATVTIGDVTGTTINGGCNLENVPVGIQTITVTKTGFEEYMDSIDVSLEDNDFTIILTESE